MMNDIMGVINDMIKLIFNFQQLLLVNNNKY